MIRLAFIAASLVLTAGPALAQDNPLREGTYFGSGEGGELTVELKHLDSDVYAIDIEARHRATGAIGRHEKAA